MTMKRMAKETTQGTAHGALTVPRTVQKSARVKAKNTPADTAKMKAGTKKKISTAKQQAKPETGGLSKELLLKMHDLMVKSRVLEERLIQIYKMGEAFFWIGGPGEEAFGVSLGLLANKGQGLD